MTNKAFLAHARSAATADWARHDSRSASKAALGASARIADELRMLRYVAMAAFVIYASSFVF